MMSMQVQLSTFMYIVYSNKQIGYGSGHGYPEDHQKMDLFLFAKIQEPVLKLMIYDVNAI